MASIEGNNVSEKTVKRFNLKTRGAGLDGRVGLHRLPTLDFGIRGYLKL